MTTTIPHQLIFQDGLIKHQTVNLDNGVYQVERPHDCGPHFKAHIVDNKLTMIETHFRASLNDGTPGPTWFFEYNDNMDIYRQFPSQPKELFCNKNWSLLTEMRKRVTNMDVMLGEAIGSSMQGQMHGGFKSVEKCQTCHDNIYTFNDGGSLVYCKCSASASAPELVPVST